MSETIQLQGKTVRKSNKEHKTNPKNCNHNHRSLEGVCTDCGILVKGLGICDICGEEVGKENLEVFKGFWRCEDCMKKTVDENKSLVSIEKAFDDL